MATLTAPSTPLLSESARHLVYPPSIVESVFPAIVPTLDEMGVRFDPWQVGFGTLALGLDESGKYASTVGGVCASIPRQVGKTFTVGSLLVALCIHFPGLRVIWTAHRSRTATNTFNSLKSMTSKPAVKPLMLDPRNTNGEQEVRFRNGSVIMFGAREQGFGRGFDEIDFLVFDEAQILTIKALEDMVAATNQARHEHGALLFFIGTPPRPVDPGEMFAAKRRRALSGGLKNGVYVEFSAEQDADPDDEAQWRKANVSYPMRTPLESMQRLRENLPDEAAWRREALGIWDSDEQVSSLVGRDDWSACGVDKAPDGARYFAVKFAADGSRVAVAGCRRPDEGPLHVELIGAHSGSMAAGTRSLAAWLAERDSAQLIVVDGAAHAGPFVNALRDLGVPQRRIVTPTWPQVAEANATLLEEIVTSGVTHLATEGQEALDASVLGCSKKLHGDKGAWSWSPITPDVDAVPVAAASLAVWAAKTKKPKTGRAVFA